MHSWLAGKRLDWEVIAVSIKLELWLDARSALNDRFKNFMANILYVASRGCNQHVWRLRGLGSRKLIKEVQARAEETLKEAEKDAFQKQNVLPLLNRTKPVLRALLARSVRVYD